MRKKSWGRLGVAIGSVALLAGGLVGVAAPTQALTTVEVEVGGTVYQVQDFGALTSGVYGSAPGGGYDYWDCQTAVSTYILANVSHDSYSFDPDNGFECHAMAYRDETEQEKCEGSGGTWDSLVDGGVCYPPLTFPDTGVCLDGQKPIDGKCVDDGLVPPNIDCDWDAGEEYVTGEGCVKPPAPIVNEPVQLPPPPPPCWDASINNCPVGGALRFTAPKYAMVGVPVTMYAYASWRPDANAPSQPTNGTAVIRVDGEDYSGVEFKDGVAEWRFIPEAEGIKELTASGVVFSGLSGANAYIDTAEARTYVLEYDPAAYESALKNKRVEVGDTYVITDPNQARSYVEDRYEWSVSEKSDDVCAVYETKKGAVKAKFNGEGKCTVIWMDKESEEEGKYTFIAKK